MKLLPEDSEEQRFALYQNQHELALMGFLNFGIELPYKAKSKSMNYYIDWKGYMRFRDSHILVHRWMAEKKVGRKLIEGEVVHHIDRNKWNNYPENLYICRSQFHHHCIHLIDARKFGWTVSMIGFNRTLLQRIEQNFTTAGKFLEFSTQADG